MTRPISAFFAVLLILCVGTATAATKLEKRVEDSTAVLEQLAAIPEKGIPSNLLNSAYAVAVIPNVIKAGFIIGGKYGQGVLVIRRPNGEWSNPSFITLAGGSVGFQAGAQASDLVLVFKTKRGVENIYKGKFTLGGDMAVAAGPVGRYTSASTDLQMKAEIYAYARNRGLFGGISLDGAALSMDKKSNFAYYQTGDGTARNILADDAIPAPIEARRFKDVLGAAAPSLAWQPAGSRQASAARPAAPAQESGARTYGLDDAPPANGDVIF